MARKASAVPEVGQPTLTPQQALARYREVKQRIDDAAAKRAVSAEDMSVLMYALESALTEGRGGNHTDIMRITHAGESPVVILDSDYDEAEEARERVQALAMKSKLLAELIRQTEGAIAANPPPAAMAAPQLRERSAADRVLRILERFHRVARKLRKRHGSQPPLVMGNEYDVQYLLHALLEVEFEDIRPEEWTPSYGGNSSRVDFLLRPEEIVIEAKMTRAKLGNKEVVDQLAVDIERYRVQPGCKTLICFVYDPSGSAKNPRGIERDLAKLSGNGLEVICLITP